MQRDLIVSFLSSVPSSLLERYTTPPLRLVCPVGQRATAHWPGGRQGYRAWLAQYAARGSVVPGMFKAAGAQPGDTIGRVCIMGFSNGCIGVDEVLRFDDSDQIDCVLAVDGIHGGYVQDRGRKALHPPAYKNYLNHGAQLVQYNPNLSPSAPVMVVTHSGIVPGSFPSTKETTGLIWDYVWQAAPEDVLTLECGFDCAPVLYEEQLAAMEFTKTIKGFTWHGFADGWYDRRIANNLFVLGWGEDKGRGYTTRDPAGTADHIFQGQSVLPSLLAAFTVQRWNADCGLVATSGPDTAEGCVPGSGLVYGDAPAAKTDYFPDLPSAVPVTVGCPPPPPGHVLVGSATDPCATVSTPADRRAHV